MNVSLKRVLLVNLVIVLLTASCASTRTLHKWKDEQFTHTLGKTLVISVAENDYMRNHFENVLSLRLGDSGIEAVASNKVIPHLGQKPDREAIAAKVREMGIQNVIVARAISKDEYSRLVPGGVYVMPTDYQTGWGSFYSDSFTMVAAPGTAYDSEFFTVVTNAYEVTGEKLIWSYLSRVRVETSRQGAINPFIETLIKELKSSKLI